MANQRRSNLRKRTLLQGQIVFNSRFSLIACAVRYLSRSGAQIAFAPPIDVAPEFELEIPSKGLSLWSRVSWSIGRGARSGSTWRFAEGTLDEARHRINRQMSVPTDAIDLDRRRSWGIGSMTDEQWRDDHERCSPYSPDGG
jgi:hypothetical protein